MKPDFWRSDISHFKPCNRHQPYLLPPSIDEWLPENHLTRFIIEIIEQLDLTRLTNHYSGKGSQAYHPAMMLALLVYGYATGTFSSHKVERATHHSVAFRFLAANQHPDHDTIATFAKFFAEIAGIVCASVSNSPSDEAV